MFLFLQPSWNSLRRISKSEILEKTRSEVRQEKRKSDKSLKNRSKLPEKNLSELAEKRRSERIVSAEKRKTLKPKKCKPIISNTVLDYKTDRDLCAALASDEGKMNWVCTSLDKCTSEEECLLKELKRLKSLKSFNILDTNPERRFEQISGMACNEFDVPFAKVSLVDLGRTWCKSIRGLGKRNCPRSMAFCPHAMLSKKDVMVVPDTTKDKRFMNHPSVNNPPFVRFYAGTALVSPDGYKIGTLCIISNKVRPLGLSEEERERLKELARMAVQVMVQRKLSTELKPEILSPLRAMNFLDDVNLSSCTKEFQLGGLTFTFTDKFELRWSIKETKSHSAVSFYHPLPENGFHALSTILLPHNREANGTEACLCVKSRDDDALKPPTSYKLLWSTVGYGPEEGGSCWRPIPPQGYVCLGDVFVKGFDSPALIDVICIRDFYTASGVIGYKTWEISTDTGVSSEFNVYESLPTLATTRLNKARIGAQSFLAESTFAPVDQKLCHSLFLPLEVKIEKNLPFNTELFSLESPDPYSHNFLNYKIPIPCTAINLSSLSRQLRYSPLYFLDISFKHRLEHFEKNNTTTPKKIGLSLVAGIDEDSLNTFSVTTWLTITFSDLIHISSNTGRFSYCHKLDLDLLEVTFTENTFKYSQVGYQNEIFPQQACAVWSLVCIVSLKDAKDETIGKPLEFALNEVIEDFYPKVTFCDE